jgi:hypothetical protein
MFSKVIIRIKEISSAFSKELIRKSIHLSIAFIPLIAGYSVAMAIVLLMSGLLIYLMAENTRLAGQRVPFITALTEIASRKRDEGHLVMGPVTLALGAMFSLFSLPLTCGDHGYPGFGLCRRIFFCDGEDFREGHHPLHRGKNFDRFSNGLYGNLYYRIPQWCTYPRCLGCGRLRYGLGSFAPRRFRQRCPPRRPGLCPLGPVVAFN